MVDRINLPLLLRFEDRNSMAFGIEARVPFVDHELMEFALSLPEEFLIRDGSTKAVLRDASKSCLPPEVLNRRDKIGFQTNEWTWLQDNRSRVARTIDQYIERVQPIFHMISGTSCRTVQGQNQALVLFHGVLYALPDGQRCMALMSSRRRFILISPSVISSDPRVLAHLSVLKLYGEVTTAGYGPPPSGIEDHIRVPDQVSYLPIGRLRRFAIPKNPIEVLNIFLRRFEAAAKGTAFTRRILAVTKDSKFDLVCTNDVHAVRVGLQIASQNEAPLWVDMHEYAPLQGESDWRWRLVLQRYVTFIVTKYLKCADVISTVGDRIKETYESDLGKPVVLIRNTVPYVEAGGLNKRIHDPNGPLRLVHVGAAIRLRRLEQMLEAVASLNNVSLDFYLIPTDKKYYSQLKDLSLEHENISINSPVNLDDVISTITLFDGGLLSIAKTNFNHENCLPNKLFQYIQARLPIISSPLPEIEAVIRKYGIGWIAADESVNSLREVVRHIANTRGLLIDVKANLERAAQELSRESDDGVRETIVQQLLHR